MDNVDKAVVRDGSVLALSAAMPGLLGATMRKGGRYAAFRKDISQHGDVCGICETPGRVTVKLFNMVARERSAVVCWKRVSGRRQRPPAGSAARYPGELSRSIRSAHLDDRKIAADPAILSTLPAKQVLAVPRPRRVKGNILIAMFADDCLIVLY